MFSSVRTEHDHTQEMAAGASTEPASAVPLPPPDNTTAVYHSESAVAVPDNRQLHATTTELAGLMKSAILSNDQATVNHLLDQGVDPNIRRLEGETPLYWAIIFDMRENIIKTLLDRGADPNLPARHLTPLLLAALLGNDKALALLLDRGADLNPREHDDCTALHIATHSGKDTAITKIQNCLLDRGAYINALDHLGKTPLLIAVFQGSIAGINNLLQAGANPDIPDSWGDTPLTKTVDSSLDHSKINSIVNSLLANGANPNKPNRSGKTPLHLALEKARPEIVDMLLANGARADIPNASGQTALDIAAAKGVIDALHNYIPAYRPKTLSACARTCIRSRLVENRVPLAKALAPDTDCLPLPNSMKAYLYQPLTF